MKHQTNFNKKLLAVNSGSSLLSWVLKTLLLFGIQKYLLSRVSLAEYSLYPVMASIMIFIDLIRNLLSGGVSRFTVEADVQGDTEKMTTIASTMFVIQGLAAAVLVILGSVLTWYIPDLITVDPQFRNDARIMMGTMIVSFTVTLATTSFETGLFARQKFFILNGLELGSVILRILIMVTLFMLFSVRVIWIVLAAEGANIAAQIIKVMISRKLIPSLRFRRGYTDWKKARELLTYSSWSFVQVVSYRLFTNFDPIILNKFAAPFDVTVFYLGSLIKKQITTVLMRITTPIMPSLIGMHALEEHDRLKRAYYQFGRYYTWLFMAATMPFIVFGYEFIDLYVGRSYSMAATVMILLCVSYIPSLGNNMIYRTAVAQGRIKPVAIWSLAGQTVNIALTIYFVAFLKLGALGSALASFLVSFFMQPLYEFRLAHIMLGVRMREWFRKTFLPGFIPPVLALGIFLAIRFIDTPDSWMELILYSTVGEAAYIFIIFLVFDRNERQIVRNIIGKILKKRVPE